jgi:hypothetical protein
MDRTVRRLLVRASAQCVQLGLARHGDREGLSRFTDRLLERGLKLRVAATRSGSTTCRAPGCSCCACRGSCDAVSHDTLLKNCQGLNAAMDDTLLKPTMAGRAAQGILGQTTEASVVDAFRAVLPLRAQHRMLMARSIVLPGGLLQSRNSGVGQSADRNRWPLHGHEARLAPCPPHDNRRIKPEALIAGWSHVKRRRADAERS